MKSALSLLLFFMVFIAWGCFNKYSWIESQRNRYLTIKVTNPNTLLLGDSIIAELARYQIVWKKYLVSLNAMNLEIGSDRVENVLRRTISLPLPLSAQNIVVQGGTNNISTDFPFSLYRWCSTICRRKSSTVNIIIRALIPRYKIKWMISWNMSATKMVLFLYSMIMDGLSRMDPLMASFSTKISTSSKCQDWPNQ